MFYDDYLTELFCMGFFMDKMDVNHLVEEETAKVLSKISNSFPKEVVQNMDVMGEIKSSVQQVYNKSISDIQQKFQGRSFLNNDKLSFRKDKSAQDYFSKSVSNINSQLQSYIQQGLSKLESDTKTLLNPKSDIGAFLTDENAYSVIKSVFSDNKLKPKTVMDVKLAINIQDSELINPIFHYQVSVEYLIKNLLSKQIVDAVESEVKKISSTSPSQSFLEKINRVSSFSDESNLKSRHYASVSKELMEKLSNVQAEVDVTNVDPMSLCENIKKITDVENIREHGFNAVVSSLTSILDSKNMGYQYIENLRNAREFIVKEYEISNTKILPDEHYEIHVKYYDSNQIIAERNSYLEQLKIFEKEEKLLWNILHTNFQGFKYFVDVVDYADLVYIYNRKMAKNRAKASINEMLSESENIWDGLSYVKASETDVEKLNSTCLHEKNRLLARITKMREDLFSIYGNEYPIERTILQERIDLMQNQFEKFDRMVNPFQLRPGLLIDIDMTSIKKKKTTINGMMEVLQNFLPSIAQGFGDGEMVSYTAGKISIPEVENVATKFAIEKSKSDSISVNDISGFSSLKKEKTSEILKTRSSSEILSFLKTPETKDYQKKTEKPSFSDFETKPSSFDKEITQEAKDKNEKQ